MWRRPLAAGVLLLGLYVGLSFLGSPRGFLGTDTGAKVATLEVMTRGPGISWDPDVGYWAERWDPDGSLHPLYDTARIGERWVSVTTLPMLVAAAPLYEFGGYRAALLLPMAGAVAAAYAARALAVRLGDARGGWRAFWIIGLASPLTIYALDLWEHALGVGLMGWGVVRLWDVVASDGRRWPAAASAGAIFGLAATMRTETLVYVAATGVGVAVALVAPHLRAQDRLAQGVRMLRSGGAAVAAFAAVVVANDLAERALLGHALRSARAGGAASIAGDAPGARLTEAGYTLFGAVGTTRGVLLGVAATALIGASSARAHRDATFAAVAVGGAAAVVGLRFTDGLGFVPGLFVAWPLAVVAVVALARGWLRPWPAAAALAALPVVLATQYRGGAAPQWAGRYVLTSGFLLTVVAVVVLGGVPARARRASFALAAAVTVAGVAWLAVRSHAVADAVAAIDSRPEPIVVSGIAHLAREGGASYGSKPWLNALTPERRAEAAAVVAKAGRHRLLFVDLDSAPPVAPPAGWRRVGDRGRVELVSGVELRLTTWGLVGA